MSDHPGRVVTRGGARKGAGRPPKPAADKSSERVEIRITPAQLAQLDHDRGAESRSSYLARRAGLTRE